MEQTTLEAVHQFILDYLIEHEKLPKSWQVAKGLGASHADVMACVERLHKDGRLRKASMYPLEYDTYWRENIRAEDAPNVRLAPLPTVKFKSRPSKKKEAG